MLHTQNTWTQSGSTVLDWPSIAVASSKLCPRPARPTTPAKARVENDAILRLGTIFVAGELVVVSGSVSEGAAATGELEVNGHQVAITASGSFCASVRLAGETALMLSLTTEQGETITIQVPLRASTIRARVLPAHDGPPQRRHRLIAA